MDDNVYLIVFLFVSIRVLPHQQNTGGFFVAVLQKTAPLPWEASAKAAVKAEETPEADAVKVKMEDEETPEDKEAVKQAPESGRRSPARKKRKIQGYKEDPYFFFDHNEELWSSIKYIDLVFSHIPGKKVIHQWVSPTGSFTASAKPGIKRSYFHAAWRRRRTSTTPRQPSGISSN